MDALFPNAVPCSARLIKFFAAQCSLFLPLTDRRSIFFFLFSRTSFRHPSLYVNVEIEVEETANVRNFRDAREAGGARPLLTGRVAALEVEPGVGLVVVDRVHRERHRAAVQQAARRAEVVDEIVVRETPVGAAPDRLVIPCVLAMHWRRRKVRRKRGVKG